VIKVDWDNLNKDDKELMLKFRYIIDAYDDESIDSTKITEEKREFVTAIHDFLNYIQSFEKAHDDVIGHILKYQRHIIENFVVKFYTTIDLKIFRKKKLDNIFNEEFDIIK
jgi:hypothetical protein